MTDNTLNDALKEYRAALRGAPFPGEAGWMDDFQRRRRRLGIAANTLLAAAATPELNGNVWIVTRLDWEDFHIVGVFLDKCEADAAAKRAFARDQERGTEWYPVENLYHIGEYTVNQVHNYEGI